MHHSLHLLLAPLSMHKADKKRLTTNCNAGLTTLPSAVYALMGTKQQGNSPFPQPIGDMSTRSRLHQLPYLSKNELTAVTLAPLPVAYMQPP